MNEIKINLGAWSSVFAVPSEIVDKHIKLAGAAQLKVLLWILKNAANSFSAEDIGAALSMHTADVKDCIEFWVEAGLLSKNEETLLPKLPVPPANAGAYVHTASGFKSEPEENTKSTAPSSEPADAEKEKTRALSRPQRPDAAFIAQRINGDPALKSLMEEAQIILGRPLSQGDCSTLLIMHDNDGLPVAVILMILQYAVSEHKGMRYIEKLGLNWASEGIDTLEKADEKIKEINRTKDAWTKVSRIFGISNMGTPTKKQLECASRWLYTWGYSTEMIREAYETCVNKKGEYNLSYIDGIIKKWQKDAIFTITDLENSKNTKMLNKTKKATPEKASSYDIDAYESFSIFDKEEE